MIALFIVVAFLAGAVLGMYLRVREIERRADSNAEHFYECINELSRRAEGRDMLRRKQ